MLLKEKTKFIIPDIPKGYKAHPFSIGDEFSMPKKLVNILDDNGFDFNEYKNSFVVPPQAYLKHWFGRRFPKKNTLEELDLEFKVEDFIKRGVSLR